MKTQKMKTFRNTCDCEKLCYLIKDRRKIDKQTHEKSD